MPIYEYECSACGHEAEILQKISDPVQKKCPACGKLKLRKRLTAAGFQLKGSGWYATDFKGPAKKSEAKVDGKADSKSESKPETKTETKTETKKASAPETTD